VGYPRGVRRVLASLLLLSTAGCPASGTLPPSAASGDAGQGGEGGQGGGVALEPQPDTWVCAADDGGPGACISGTAELTPALDRLFTTSYDPQHPGSWQVTLFGVYPTGSAQPLSTRLVARDGTWAFDRLGADGGAPWSHYYVQAAVVFSGKAGRPPVSAVVGPLSGGASNVAIVVRPLQVTVLESRLAGGSMQLDWVLARLFDPTTGVEITGGAQVSVTAGGTATALAPTMLGAAGQVYFVQFAQPPAAQPGYTVTASHPSFGDAGLTAQLVADPPAFDGTITGIDAGSGGGVTVTWTAEPQADYELAGLYASTGDGGWASAPSFLSPRPDPPGQTSETFAGVEAGTYLVNVAYTKASCPADAGGCVQASTVAVATVTVP
jgi:hypothetical protein